MQKLCCIDESLYCVVCPDMDGVCMKSQLYFSMFILFFEEWFLYILTPTKKVALSSDLTGTLVFGC